MPSGMAELKVAGGKLVRAEVEVEGGRLVDVKITGDFFLYPEEAILDIESSLRGLSVENDYSSIIESKLSQAGAQLVGAAPGDVAEAIRRAVKEALGRAEA
ncbi:MAG: hypothetical protein N3H31_03920 [Candidatus Nezhaarchaeota archaeon]|nr:hypothetical protein [Candidatus Nezhaarchaeota archaeon]